MQAAEISRLKLNLKTANDRACQLHVENSSLKDELKAQQTHFPSIDSDREVSQVSGSSMNERNLMEYNAMELEHVVSPVLLLKRVRL